MSFETLNANCNGQNRVILKHGSHLEAWILWLPFLLVKAKILNKNPLCQKGTTEKKAGLFFYEFLLCLLCTGTPSREFSLLRKRSKQKVASPQNFNVYHSGRICALSNCLVLSQ